MSPRDFLTGPEFHRKNTASQLQPADAGIIRNLKSNLENVWLDMLHPC